MIIIEGKTVKAHKNIHYLEAQLSKDMYNPNVVGLCNGQYKYTQREYPPMEQYFFGRNKTKVYDIDFNNFFLRAFKEYIVRNNINSKPAKQNLLKLNRIIRMLQVERENLKSKYLLIYNPHRFRTVSNEVISFTGYNTDKPTKRDLMKTVSEVCGDYITEDTLIELSDKVSTKYSGHYRVINKYHFHKYLHLAAIGWLKKKNEQLWWNIMKHATEKMNRLIEFCQWNGHTVYNCYIDSIQVNANILKKYPELFEFYEAKLDKSGSDYGLVLPPSYWINKEKARWMSIDYKDWFNTDRVEPMNYENIKLLYLKRFAETVNHPIKNYIEIDTDKVITNKLDGLEPHRFIWDFVKRKTEAEKYDTDIQTH